MRVLIIVHIPMLCGILVYMCHSSLLLTRTFYKQRVLHILESGTTCIQYLNEYEHAHTHRFVTGYSVR